jgi:hypothetical protein
MKQSVKIIIWAVAAVVVIAAGITGLLLYKIYGDTVPEGTYKIQGAGSTVERNYFGTVTNDDGEDVGYTYGGENYAVSADGTIKVGDDRVMTFTNVGTHSKNGSTLTGNTDYPIRYVPHLNGKYTVEKKLPLDDEFHEFNYTWNENGTDFNVSYEFTYKSKTIKLVITYKLAGDGSKGWTQTFTFKK